MACFMYFKQGHDGEVTGDNLTSWNLDDRFESQPMSTTGAVQGVSGMLFCDQDKLKGDQSLSYQPDRQTWMDMDNGLNLGYWNNDIPKASDLERSRRVDGYWMELGDDKWAVPTIRMFVTDKEASSKLPMHKVYRDGKWQDGDILKEYKYLADLTAPFHAELVAALEKSLGDDEDDGILVDYSGDVCKEAVEILSVNYLIGPEEASALRLFTSFNESRAVLQSAIDADRTIVFYAEKMEVKKKQQATINTEDGVPV